MSSAKSDKINRNYCLVKKSDLLNEVEFEQTGPAAPVLFLRDHINRGEKSLFEELAEAAECEVNSSPNTCLSPKIASAGPATGNNGNGSGAPVLAKQDRRCQGNLEPCLNWPNEIIMSGARVNSATGQKRRPNCGSRRQKNRKAFRNINVVNPRRGQYISVIRLVECSNYILKVSKFLLKYNNTISCRLSFKTGKAARKNQLARFDKMRAFLEHIAQRLDKVRRNYCAQIGEEEPQNDNDDSEAQNKNPKDRLICVVYLMGRVKERLFSDIKSAQSDFLAGMKIFVKVLENYPFLYLYESRLAILYPTNAAQVQPAGAGTGADDAGAAIKQDEKETDMEIIHSIHNVLKNSIVIGCLSLLVVAASWIFLD